MRHRRYARSRARQEAFFQLVFLMLLLLSVLRAVDLLPASKEAAQPVLYIDTPAQAPALPLCPVPISLHIGDVRTVRLSQGLTLRGTEPRILIYHTHTTEAYTATEASPYVQTGSYRTADASKSVLAVGEALAQRLRLQYGFSVIHDTTDHEPPSLKTAYERSEATMRRYLEAYPSLVLFIDIHRDASSDTSDYVMVNGRPTARLMCVVGQGTKYQDKPDFDRNYALAEGLTEHLRAVDGRLARNVRVKTGRYNQHVGELSLLIEVGHNANTLEQALNAVPSLAESLALTLAETDAKHAAEDHAARGSLSLVPDMAGIDKG